MNKRKEIWKGKWKPVWLDCRYATDEERDSYEIFIKTEYKVGLWGSIFGRYGLAVTGV
jgi:hypothetical protein